MRLQVRQSTRTHSCTSEAHQYYSLAGVICILAGDYPESINITRSVSLVGLPSIPGNVSTNPTIKSISRRAWALVLFSIEIV
jgi:hypothetical protein